MLTKQPKRILVAPLDWGMGHTTRCLPLMHYLRASGHIPVFAGNDWQLKFIEEIFPGIEKIHIEGYGVKWTGRMLDFLRQVPRLRRTIADEHKWLTGIATDLKLDGIISDNRYGLYHPTLPTVILTHQLKPQSGFGYISDTLARLTHDRLLRKFREIWVVDVQDSGLAGKLSRREGVPHPTHYIGLLSPHTGKSVPDLQTPGSILVLLSGPEPQRSMLSELLKAQFSDFKGALHFVEGADVTNRGSLPLHVWHYGRLTPDQVLPMLQEAETVICRSGYSTLMDLVTLDKKAILIPTPGQTEQEYLAKHLQVLKRFFVVAQDKFVLDDALKESGEMTQIVSLGKSNFTKFMYFMDEWTKGL